MLFAVFPLEILMPDNAEVINPLIYEALLVEWLIQLKMLILMLSVVTIPNIISKRKENKFIRRYFTSTYGGTDDGRALHFS